MRFIRIFLLFFALPSLTPLRGAEPESAREHVYLSTCLPAEMDGRPVASALLPDGSALIAVNRPEEESAKAMLLRLEAEGKGLTLWREVPGKLADMVLRGGVVYVTGTEGTRSFLMRFKAPERVWTNLEGREVRGSVVDVLPEVVSLSISGRRVRIPKETLSPEDLDYLQNDVLMPRLWTDPEGRILWGRLTRAEADGIEIRNPRGPIHIPMDLLSEPDQAYVQRFRDELNGGTGWESDLVGEDLTPGPDGTLFVRNQPSTATGNPPGPRTGSPVRRCWTRCWRRTPGDIF